MVFRARHDRGFNWCPDYGDPVWSRDEILITELEHHSNIVPWQLLCEQIGTRLAVVPVTDNGDIELDAVKSRLNERTRIVALAHASNTLGTILPVKAIAKIAHAHGAIVVVDGAQGAPHLTIDVQDLDVDFYALSGHKLYGPTGSGALYGRREIFEKLPPYQGGGGMIRRVTFEKTYDASERYEEERRTSLRDRARRAAANSSIRPRGLEAHENDRLNHGTSVLSEIPGVRIIGTAPRKIAVISFVVEGVHPHDLGTIVDSEGVAIRTGHHCTQPLMDRFGLPATARASLGMYNTRQDLDALGRAVKSDRDLRERSPRALPGSDPDHGKQPRFSLSRGQ